MDGRGERMGAGADTPTHSPNIPTAAPRTASPDVPAASAADRDPTPRWAQLPAHLGLTVTLGPVPAELPDAEQPWPWIHVAPRAILVDFGDDVRLLVRDGRDVTLQWDPAADPDGDPSWVLQGWAVTLASLQRGELSLHAATVRIGDALVAIAGDRGAGKSTTAVGLRRRGHQLLVDDVTLIEFRDDEAWTTPYARNVHLLPDAAEALGLDFAALPPLALGRDKSAFRAEDPPTEPHRIDLIVVLDPEWEEEEEEGATLSGGAEGAPNAEESDPSTPDEPRESGGEQPMRGRSEAPAAATVDEGPATTRGASHPGDPLGPEDRWLDTNTDFGNAALGADALDAALDAATATAPTATPTITEARGADRLRALMDHTVRDGLAPMVLGHTAYFTQLARLANAAPVHVIRRPAGAWTLDPVLDAIEQLAAQARPTGGTGKEPLPDSGADDGPSAGPERRLPATEDTDAVGASPTVGTGAAPPPTEGAGAAVAAQAPTTETAPAAPPPVPEARDA